MQLNFMNFEIKNEFLVATFNTLGAELISLQSESAAYIWNGNPEFWGKHSPVLFPIVGALKEDAYFLAGKEYQLPRHGFAREKQFEIIEKTENRIIFSLKNDAETRKVYPFYFELKIEYTLVEKSLEVNYWVQNNSDDKMYFSIGGHPAFQLSNNFDDYSLLFETQNELHFSLLKNNLLSEKTVLLPLKNNCLPLDYALFEKDALVFRNHKIKSITIQKNTIDLLTVHFEQFPDLGIWTKVNAPFICIEPWFGYADTVSANQNIADKDGIQVLEANQLFSVSYQIEVMLPS